MGICSAPNVEYPGASQEEKNLMSEQTALLKQTSTESAAMKPLVLARMGYKETPNGLIKLTSEERNNVLSDMEKQIATLGSSMYGNIKNAYEGGDVSSGLNMDLATTKSGLDISEGGTSKAQSLKDFNTRADIIKDVSRRATINQGTGSYLDTMGLLNSLNQNQIDSYSAFPQRNIGLLKNYSNVLAPYGEERNRIFQLNQANAQGKLARQRGMAQLVGMGAGALTGMYVR